MSDIIYRDDAKKAIDGMIPALGNTAQEIMKALCWAAVATIPQPVDAVEVVRCKDCIKHGAYNCTCMFENSPETPDDFFCADGERGINNG